MSRIEMWLPKRVIEYHFAEHCDSSVKTLPLKDPIQQIE